MRNLVIHNCQLFLMHFCSLLLFNNKHASFGKHTNTILLSSNCYFQPICTRLVCLFTGKRCQDFYNASNKVSTSLFLFPVACNVYKSLYSITWIIPTEVLQFLSTNPLPDHLDLCDFLDPFVRQEWIQVIEPSILDHSNKEKQYLKGNLCLSSCPGKKVRLSGPVRGRATINRDLDLDFARMKSFGITMIIW